MPHVLHTLQPILKDYQSRTNVDSLSFQEAQFMHTELTYMQTNCDWVYL